MPTVDLLKVLHEFTARDKVTIPPSTAAVPELASYEPLAQYINALAKDSKPERAAEDLFVSVARDIAGLRSIPQVFVGEGFVDFLVGEEHGSGGVLIELKPLFVKSDESTLRRHPVKPENHKWQVKKYLRKHEYVVLTDLLTAYAFSARDFFFSNTWFAELPFVDLLRRISAEDLVDAIRRLEDAVEKPELDRIFFEDLKEWFDKFRNVRWQKPENSAELTILLLNKLIFAKTLEDHGLVSYRYLQDEYDRQKDLWETKGPHRVARAFLESFEPFFDEYYDTELFEQKIWNEIERDPENLERFCSALELVLGITKWDRLAQRGVVNYNYRTINEDIFGKSYEMFLAANRKDEGIYYTPATITTPMADSLVGSLFGPLVDQICAAVAADACDFEKARTLMAQIEQIHIADTAAGSGGFLIKVFRAIWNQYLRIDVALEWFKQMHVSGDLFELPKNVREAAEFRRDSLLNPEQRRLLLAAVLLRHIFAIDKDAGALEVAKTNVWKEAVKLTPQNYNYRQLKGDAQKILPNLELNFICADSLVDLRIEEQAAWLANYQQHELAELASLRQQYISSPSNHTPLEHALALREKLRANLREAYPHENLPEPPSCLALMFFPCWFEAKGRARQNGGFDGIIGNPPWEAVKPVRKEFAKINKYSMSVVQFDEWFARKVEEDVDFRERWERYRKFYDDYKEYLGRTFTHQGTGDWNLFKLFIEADLGLVRKGGRLSLLVPSSIQTDEGCTALRRWFVTDHTLNELTSFENRGYRGLVKGEEKTVKIFPDVDNRFKFGFFKLIKGEPAPNSHTFDARFYIQDPTRASDPPIKYSVALMRRFSPKNLSLMEFRSESDYTLYAKVRGEHRLLADFRYTWRRELHMTGDARFFHARGASPLKTDEMPLFEGKMIHQFSANRWPAISFVREDEVRSELFRKELHRLVRFIRAQNPPTLEGSRTPQKSGELDKLLAEIFDKRKFKLQYELPRLGYREVARSTDERTLIASLLPAHVCLAHTLMYQNPYRYELNEDKLEQVCLERDDINALLSLLNSLVLNYYLRSKVSAHVSVFQLEELPIPTLNSAQTKQLAKSAEILSEQSDNLKERARLEVFIGRELYRLTADDWEHLTSTFTFGGDSDSKAELDEIIRLSLEYWDSAN